MTNELIKKQTESIISKHEAALHKSVSSSLLGKLKRNGECLLIDVSGSMNDHITEGTRHSVTQKVIKNFPDSRKFAFQSITQELQSDFLPTPSGGTNMGLAFSHVKSAGIKHIVLITDGIPDSQDYALQESVGLEIDIIYIGPDPIPEFLTKLAAACKGQFHNVKMVAEGSSKLLGDKIKGLLNS